MFSNPIFWGPPLANGITLAVGEGLWLLLVGLSIAAGLGILFNGRRARGIRPRLARRAPIVGFRRSNGRLYAAK